MNAFETFSLEPTLVIDLEHLKESYKSLAAKHHPDSGGDIAQFEQLNEHFAILQSPAKRLTAFMEAQDISYDPRGAVSNDLMDLFMQVGQLIQEADSFLRKKAATTSALGKALLESQSMELQESLSERISNIEAEHDKLTQSLNSDTPLSDLPQVARNLAFLEKWQAQLRQRYAALF